MSDSRIAADFLRPSPMRAREPASPSLPKIRIENWRPVQKGGLLGFVDCQLGDLMLIGLAVMRSASNGSKWVALRSRPQLDSEGRPLIDPVTGKKLYAPQARWANRQAGDDFSRAVIAAIQQLDPDALEP